MPMSYVRVRWMIAALALVLAAATGLAQQPMPGQKPQPPGAKPQNPGGFGRPPAAAFPTAPQEIELVGTRIRVVPVAGGLANPWSIAFLPNGDMLVTERPGRLRIVRNGQLDPTPVGGVPEVFAMGQGGLLEVLPHPNFAQNQWLYLTYSKPGQDNTATTALARGRFDGKALTDVKDLLVADNWNKGGIHFGSKLAFGPDGLLYMTLGERTDRDRSQNLNSHGGKTLRLRDDGTAAPGNPFAGRADAKPEIYSYGHRNAQGLAFHPDTGQLWSNEHGPQGGDELNIILPGKNYGWPVVTHGREYGPGGALISRHTWREDVEDPVLLWSPSIGISGLLFYTGDTFPFWKGQIFVGGLSGLRVDRVAFNEKGGLLGRDAITLNHRIRDVRQGPDGNIYLAVDSNPGGVLRLEPAQAQTSATGQQGR
jgi:aldose sugar dehydrogenase